MDSYTIEHLTMPDHQFHVQIDDLDIRDWIASGTDPSTRFQPNKFIPVRIVGGVRDGAVGIGITSVTGDRIFGTSPFTASSRVIRTVPHHIH